MLTLVALIWLAGLVYGFVTAGLLGALTATVVILGAGSGISVFVGAKGTHLSAGQPARTAQRIGGFLAAAGVIVGGLYGQWKMGWAWGLLGYGAGMASALLLAYLGANGRNEPAGAALQRGRQSSTNGVPLLTVDEFRQVTAGGRPNEMKTHIYDAHSYQCACGSEHVFQTGDTVIMRELSGMRLVFACPVSSAVTCVKVAGLIRFQGFQPVCGVPPIGVVGGGRKSDTSGGRKSDTRHLARTRLSRC